MRSNKFLSFQISIGQSSLMRSWRYSVSKYVELSVSKFWRFVLQFPDLLAYFPDLDGRKLPDKSFLIKILSTLRAQELKQLLKEAGEHRACSNNDEKDQNFLSNSRPLKYFSELYETTNFFAKLDGDIRIQTYNLTQFKMPKRRNSQIERDRSSSFHKTRKEK